MVQTHTNFYLLKNWERMTQKTKPLSSNVLQIPVRRLTKLAHYVDTQNVLAQVQIKNVADGKHGKTYVPRQRNILIGAVRHLHAVAQKG